MEKGKLKPKELATCTLKQPKTQTTFSALPSSTFLFAQQIQAVKTLQKDNLLSNCFVELREAG